MFLNLLSEAEKDLFLEVAELVCQCDNRIRWNGKTEDEMTADDAAGAALLPSEAEQEALGTLIRECGPARDPARRIKVRKLGHVSLFGAIKALPLLRQNDPDERTRIGQEAITSHLKTLVPRLPATPKIFLFELMLLCHADGVVSEVEFALLKSAAECLGIDDYLFDELYERAVATHQVAQKTAALVLE